MSLILLVRGHRMIDLPILRKLRSVTSLETEGKFCHQKNIIIIITVTLARPRNLWPKRPAHYHLRHAGAPHNL